MARRKPSSGSRRKAGRAYTAEEARAHFLARVRDIARYWASVPDDDITPYLLDGSSPTQHRCEGVAFSMLVLFDGMTADDFPGLDLVVRSWPEEVEDRKADGRNWYEPGQVINGDSLHEHFHERRKGR